MTGLFPATSMPDRDWWTALWPDPEGVLRELGVSAGKTAVDLCCGDGHFTAPLARIAAPGTVYALELDPDVLRLARERVAGEGSGNCVFFREDATNVARCVSERAEFVLLANALHGVPDKTGFAREVREALAPEGRLAVVDWHPATREQTSVLGEPRGPAEEFRLSPEQSRAAVEPAGFVLEKVVELPPYHYGALFAAKG